MLALMYTLRIVARRACDASGWPAAAAAAGGRGSRGRTECVNEIINMSVEKPTFIQT